MCLFTSSFFSRSFTVLLIVLNQLKLSSGQCLLSDGFQCSPSDIEPSALRRKAVTDKLVEKIVKHDS